MEIFAWIGILFCLLALSFAVAFVIALIEGNGNVSGDEFAVGLTLVVVILCIILASEFSNPKMFKLEESVSTNTIEETK